MPKKYFIDLDNTLCITQNSNYDNSTPILERIEYVNNLKKEGNYITIWTARGATSGINHSELTKKQLDSWGAKHHELRCDKPYYDLFIDDKNLRIEDL